MSIQQIQPVKGAGQTRVWIDRLESRYPYRDHSASYSRLVNFSSNAKTPLMNWFRYREGFAGKLIEELIQDSGALPGEVIADPFSGSGTTPVTAQLQGYHGFGIDVNPLSAFIADVKTARYSSETLSACFSMGKQIAAGFPEKATQNKIVWQCPDIARYFTPQSYEALCLLRAYIETLSDQKIQSIFLTAFLCIVEICSNRRRDGNGLRTVPTKVTDVPACFQEKLTAIVTDLQHAEQMKKGAGVCVAGSAKDLSRLTENIFSTGAFSNLPPQQKKIGAVIFSPPYPNSFDYFESYKLELLFGGFAPGIAQIKTYREQAVRSFVGGKTQEESDPLINSLSQEIADAIPRKEAVTGKRDIRTRKVPSMLKGYFADMETVLQECRRCLKPDGKVYIVVDQSAYAGVVVPTDLLLAYLAEQTGFQVVEIIECRKARTSTQQLRLYPHLKNALRESIVVLKNRK